MHQAKVQYQSTFFMEIFTIAAWEIWKQRNNFIFNSFYPGRSPLELKSWELLVVF